jgi:hypothetical protein
VDDIKARIRDARVSAALAVNQALIVLYWEIGREILRPRPNRGGVPRESTGWRPICGVSSRT